MLFRTIHVIAIAGILLMAACSEPQRPGGAALQPEEPILRERAEKDAHFLTPDSPLLPSDRAAFHGLHYYPLDPALKFSVLLHRYPAPARLRMGTNTGEIRNALRYGYFDFQVGGQNCRLQVYRLEEALESGRPDLFIPFRDVTSGQETYAAGRYLDLKENTSGTYDLDFNRAYNPTCAYNNTYSCPLPPAENTLKVPIHAGEKQFH